MICIPIMARNNSEVIKKIAQATPHADMLEIRLDVMESFEVKEILQAASIPVIITYRSKKEGGMGAAKYETRIRYLTMAIEAGADFVDVEYSLPLEYRERLFQMRGSSKIIISKHLSNKTPSKAKLEDLFRKMVSTGADVIKIITYAKKPEDNILVLGLIPLAKKLGIKIITFCMGPMGRISRLSTLLTGGFLSFSSLERGEESASGQIPVRKMRKLLEMLT